MPWVQWIGTNWSRLGQREKVRVPTWLPHPRLAGFYPIGAATPEGQCANWGVSCSDGSRIHVHEFPDGRLVAHRDRYDPDAGFGHAVAHLLTETFVGPLVAVGIALVIGRTLEAA